eukprot:TRINITY_DN1596_c0_g1_i2.p1 TRINITY_DN1596_c0_g1~~TRINITY_DN1596_c0_g1_i2.p1  ORF type:complete len:206 (-),score=24.83 TRINITY_DN1596_c0_g1_i2:370-987(-)
MNRLEETKAFFNSSQTKEYHGHRKKVHSVAWNCRGDKLASGSVDQTARIWGIGGPVVSKDLELKGHTNSVDQLCWDPTHPERLGTASADKTVRIWDGRTGECSQVIPTSGENINISWSPDGHHLAVGNKEDVLSIIDTRMYKIIKTTKFLFEVNEISWNNTGDLFFITTGLGQIEVMSYPSLEKVKTLHAHTANCYCIEFDPAGK